MQSLSPTSRYLQALNEGTHQPDDVQKEAVDRLETLYQALTAKKSSATPPGGLIARLGKLLGKNEPDAQIPVRGLYMWGAWGAAKPGSWISSTTACRASENYACIFIGLCCACMKNLPRYRDRSIR